MMRRCGAVTAVLALLCGFSTAPYTHVHHAVDSVSDAQHPHGRTLVHSHTSPHAHHDDDHSGSAPGDRDGSIWSVNDFVFQASVQSQPLAPMLLTDAERHAPLIRSWLGTDRLQPRGHGPPEGLTPGLRAPPAVLPVLA